MDDATLTTSMGGSTRPGITSWALGLVAALLTAGLPALAEDEDDDDRGGGTTICEQSARKMSLSCRLEVGEEYKSTQAKCINLGEPNERRACLAAARRARRTDGIGCGEQREAREAVCELLGENRFDPEGLLDTDNFVEDPDDSNPYFSLAPGHTYVARAGEDFEESIFVTVTDRVREVLGVSCRLVVDIVLVEEDDGFVAVEVTDDFYAQALNADVHYCGEVARNFEDELLVNLDGSFEAGRDLAKSGILIKASPESGDAHRQEYLLGEAEDVIRYVAGADDPTSVAPEEGGENPEFPCGGECVKTEEFIPPEPGTGEFKYFVPGIGFVLGVGLEDGLPTGERDEVLCVGDSPSIIADDPRCGVDEEDVAELLDLLCELSPVAFCDI